MITEKELVEDIAKLKEKVDIYSNPLALDFIGGHLWGEVNERLEEIVKLLKKYGCEIK